MTAPVAGNEDIALIGDRQSVARRLLAEPIVTARDRPDDFAVIRNHSEWLIRNFQRILGYELTIAADHARLAKTGLVRPVARPLSRPSGAHFSPRTYSYLALCLAVLVESPAKLPLSRLATDVRAAAAEAGLGLDPTTPMSERRAFVAALRHVAGWGVLTEREGSLRDYATHPSDEVGAAAEVWFEVHQEIAQRVVAHPPYSTPDPCAFVGGVEDGDPSSDTAGELALRRLLAETAVVYRADLSERQRGRLARHQWRAAAELGELLGCDTEVRAEGVALVMRGDGGSATADRTTAFPSADPVGQAALLLLERLTTRVRPERRPAHAVPVPADVLETELAAVTDPESALQRRLARSALSHVPDPDTLAARILRLLRDTRLMAPPTPPSVGYEGWTLLAAAARYGAAQPARHGPGETS